MRLFVNFERRVIRDEYSLASLVCALRIGIRLLFYFASCHRVPQDLQNVELHAPGLLNEHLKQLVSQLDLRLCRNRVRL